MSNSARYFTRRKGKNSGGGYNGNGRGEGINFKQKGNNTSSYNNLRCDKEEEYPDYYENEPGFVYYGNDTEDNFNTSSYSNPQRNSNFNRSRSPIRERNPIMTSSRNSYDGANQVWSENCTEEFYTIDRNGSMENPPKKNVIDSSNHDYSTHQSSKRNFSAPVRHNTYKQPFAKTSTAQSMQYKPFQASLNQSASNLYSSNTTQLCTLPFKKSVDDMKRAINRLNQLNEFDTFIPHEPQNSQPQPQTMKQSIASRNSNPPQSSQFNSYQRPGIQTNSKHFSPKKKQLPQKQPKSNFHQNAAPTQFKPIQSHPSTATWVNKDSILMAVKQEALNLAQTAMYATRRQINKHYRQQKGVKQQVKEAAKLLQKELQVELQGELQGKPPAPQVVLPKPPPVQQSNAKFSTGQAMIHHSHAFDMIRFAGNNHDNASVFLDQIDERYKSHPLGDKLKITHLTSHLKPPALHWYQALDKNSKSWNWPKWRKEMIAKFPSEQQFDLKLETMMARKMSPDETLQEYFTDKLALLSGCDLFNQKAVACLIGGLHASNFVKNQARAFNFPHSKKLLQHLKKIDLLEHINSESDKSDEAEEGEEETVSRTAHLWERPAPSCYCCQKPFHTFLTCAQPEADEEEEPEPPKDMENVRCFVCQEAGHYGPQCRQRAVTKLRNFYSPVHGYLLFSSHRVFHDKPKGMTHFTKFFTTVKVNDEHVHEAYVDFDSEFCTLPLLYAIQMRLPVVTVYDKTVSGLAGRTMRAVGEVKLRFAIDDVVIDDVHCYVVPDEDQYVPFIVGQSLLSKHDVYISTRNVYRIKFLKGKPEADQAAPGDCSAVGDGDAAVDGDGAAATVAEDGLEEEDDKIEYEDGSNASSDAEEESDDDELQCEDEVALLAADAEKPIDLPHEYLTEFTSRYGPEDVFQILDESMETDQPSGGVLEPATVQEPSANADKCLPAAVKDQSGSYDPSEPTKISQLDESLEENCSKKQKLSEDVKDSIPAVNEGEKEDVGKMNIENFTVLDAV